MGGSVKAFKKLEVATKEQKPVRFEVYVSLPDKDFHSLADLQNALEDAISHVYVNIVDGTSTKD